MILSQTIFVIVSMVIQEFIARPIGMNAGLLHVKMVEYVSME